LFARLVRKSSCGAGRLRCPRTHVVDSIVYGPNDIVARFLARLGREEYSEGCADAEADT
jgi:hypothetical protein